MSDASRWSRSLVEATRGQERTVQISRHAFLQSLAGIAFAGVLIAMIAIGAWLPGLPDDVLRGVALSIVCLASAAAIALLPSSRTRAWAKVMLAKHLFAHRYDYRAEWLRFTATLGEAGAAASPLPERAARAIADITGSPAALLLLVDGHGRLGPAIGWNCAHGASEVGDRALAEHLRAGGRVLALDALRGEEGGEAALLPRWMLDETTWWAGVPLLHAERLEGLLLLARPRIDRALDWEDFDLLKLAARQAASHLAEARSQEALADTRRFDEFNRRFAFVMHDIKNLVSQLALLARNAERHADKPAFRADMIETLNGSADRMNDMLARLSQHHHPRGEPARVLSLGRAACKAAQAKHRLHPIRVDADPCLAAWGDPHRLEQALEQLIQNAIEASAPGVPVRVATARRGEQALVIVADEGCGMTPDFVRTQLFRPFASTKPEGFGIGAYEVRALVHAMGGTLDVESVAGAGTRFTIALRAADFPAVERRADERRLAANG